MKTNKVRRSGIKIMASLVVLLGSLSLIMLLAVINGSLGFIAAMGVTVFGAVGIAKALGASILLSWEWILALTVICGLVRGLLRYIEQYSNHYIAFRLLAVLRSKIFGALRVLCPAKLEGKQKGNIIAMITSDIETLEVFYAHTLSPVCIAIVVSISVVLFVGLYVSWYLALVAIVAYLTISIIVPLISSNSLKKSGVEYRKQFADFNSYFLDSIKGVKDIVLHNAEDKRLSEVSARSGKLLHETKLLKRKTAYSTAATELIVSLFVLATVAVGISLVMFAHLHIGIAIIGIVTVMSSFGPVLAVAALPSNLTQTFASGDRVLNLLQEKPVVSDVCDGKDFVFENLNVNNLNFAYSKDVAVLQNVDFTAKRGEIVGIVGASGCGKSTFLKLLLSFWQKNSGQIAYNGVDVDHVNTKSLYDNVTMVSQTTYLFDESIADNLKIAKPEATEQELHEACKMASVHDFIMSLPNGYDTRVGTMGDNISAGEKQRIGLARAFLKGSSLILLDEPTSNVDSINEGMILRSLMQSKSNKSIILVSHRQSTMAIADRVYCMSDGIMKEATNEQIG